MSSSNPSYRDLACWYDAIYEARGKDHDAEVAALLALVADLEVSPRSLLDVACGTGNHLARFHEAIPDVVGLDASPDMLAVAAGRLPEDVPLVEGDLRTFDLGRTFDLVTCLFSSIGHVEDERELDAAIGRMAAHVAPGGVLLVEPWLTPDRVVPDGVRNVLTARSGDDVVARTASSRQDDDALVVEYAWAVATRSGAASLHESFRMPLFPQARYLEAVSRAGLSATWRDELPGLDAPRGILIGRREVEGS